MRTIDTPGLFKRDFKREKKNIIRGLTPLMLIDNNRCENAIRPFVVGRKAWLFSDTPAGANASAIIYSLVETAKANGVEPYTWLRHALEHLPAAQTADEMDKLLPWNFHVATLTKITPH